MNEDLFWAMFGVVFPVASMISESDIRVGNCGSPHGCVSDRALALGYCEQVLRIYVSIPFVRSRAGG